jgi:PRTRC genetic system protein E
MFSELNDGQWNLVVTVKEGNGTVILMPAGEEKGAVKSPIRFTGTLGELDAQLSQMLTTVMAKRTSLQEQLDEQLKAAEAEAKASAPKPKAASGGKTGSEPSRAATPAPAPKSSETAAEAGSFDLFAGG